MLSNISRFAVYCSLFACLPFVNLAKANSIPPSGSSLCAVEISTTNNVWKQLNNTCDIGAGLWGKIPKSNTGSFWVQCNYSSAIPNTNFSRKVNLLFPDNAYLIEDTGKYRCLIGPYSTYTKAMGAKQQLETKKITSTFIRHTTKTISGLAKSPTLKSVSKSKNTQVTPAKEPNNPKLNTLVENRVVLNSIIYSFTFNGLQYHQPKDIYSTENMPPMFINEQDNYWSRININSAQKWCRNYGLRLPTYDEIELLQSHGRHLLMRYRWPTEISYWTSSVNPITNEIKTLNLRSGKYDEYRPPALLYTTCVK
ncbi:SPOR domain-containing protein [Photobacterium profundum]|uniref:SPOR domain-containing protein n=1 Tax=Photobacterium profundum 3TCK TaxID=314280 RepID=Q1Z8D6_9GAMM|nr:SPOR domain-containing protein [Photobacterium profundum]EAS45172.1 hypothetical protein P3TCK_21850 [Photobacterium profundum 3TCK]